MPRVRFLFSKRGGESFISHVVLPQLLARAGRRASISFKYSEGFTPRPRISIGPALPVGVIGLNELFDVDLEHWEPSMLQKWNHYLPPGLELLKAEETEGRSLGKLCKAASYSLFVLEQNDFKDIEKALFAHMPEGSIIDLEVDDSDSEIKIDLKDPQQNSPGMFVKALRAEMLVDGWSDLRIVRRRVGYWENNRVVSPL